jgi:hypothetical protein
MHQAMRLVRLANIKKHLDILNGLLLRLML